MEEKLQQAITILSQGGIVIYPTDTAFGIGCRIDDEEAIKRLFKIRKRPESQATPVLVESVGMAGKYVLGIPENVELKLIKQYWPGALTIVMQAKTEIVPNLVRGGTETIGLRMPNHDTTLTLIRGINVPILGPSANFHGEETPYEFEQINEDLIGLVDYVVPGTCLVKKASTVIDCTIDNWKILRQGAVELKL